MATTGRQEGHGLADRHDEHVVSTGLTDRLRERALAVRRLRRRRVVRLAALVAVAAALVWALAFSPLLALRTQDISVTGSDGTVTAQEVRTALEAYEGESLLTLDVAQAARTVDEDLVRVRAATITRSWPHGLVVALAVRVPVAVHQVDGGWEVLDADAVVLESTVQAPAGLVLLVAADGQEVGATQVDAVTEAVGALDATTRARVTQGRASATGQVTLTLDTGATVVWGDTSESAKKAKVLAVLLTTTATTYDVSSPDTPTTS